MGYDYSALIKKIDDLNTEKKKLINRSDENEKDQLVDLEARLMDNGMLQDWYDLVKVLRRAEVRGCPYPFKIGNECWFSDAYTFEIRVNSGSSGYREDWYGIKPNANNEIKYYEYSRGYGSEKKIDIFATYGNDPVMRKIRVKTKIITEFIENYELYRETKLKQLYEKIGEKEKEVSDLRDKTKMMTHDETERILVRMQWLEHPLPQVLEMLQRWYTDGAISEEDYIYFRTFAAVNASRR